MKTIAGCVALSLGLIACVMNEAEIADHATSSVATELGASDLQEESLLGVTTQSCTNLVWTCQPNCPFQGGQNVLIGICDGVETIVEVLPCSPEGCF